MPATIEELQRVQDKLEQRMKVMEDTLSRHGGWQQAHDTIVAERRQVQDNHNQSTIRFKDEIGKRVTALEKRVAVISFAAATGGSGFGAIIAHLLKG